MTLPRIELRPDDKGRFDELVSSNCAVHFEMMDNCTLWVSVKSGKEEYHIWISSKSKLKVNCSDESIRSLSTSSEEK